MSDETVIVTAPAHVAGPVDVDVEIAGFQLSTVGTFIYLAAAEAPCTFAPQAAVTTLAQTGGQTAVNVATQANCAWTAAETVEWLQVVDPGAATGSGQFQVVAEANANPADWAGRVLVTGVEVMFTQPGTGCGSFSVEPANRRRDCPTWRRTATSALPSRSDRGARGRRRPMSRGYRWPAGPAPAASATRPPRTQPLLSGSAR